MKNLILLGLAISLSLFSCKNDDDTQDPVDTPVVDPAENETNYLPLTEGNYWIYENVRVEPDGNEILLEPIDSIYVAGDSLVNGTTYKILKGSKYLSGQGENFINLVRESSGDLIDTLDITIFSSTNFTDILHEDSIPDGMDPIIEREFKMERVEEVISLPAGDFDDVLNYKGKVTIEPQTLPDSIRYLHNFYAQDVGKIFETTFFISTNNIIEKRLIRYNVQ